MYTNKIFDLAEGAEVVIRRKSNYVKGVVTKTTQTQLTIKFTHENGTESVERFKKSDGAMIGGRVTYIAKHYGYWDTEKYIPDRLMTYAEADAAIQAMEAEKAIKTEKQIASQKAANDRFNTIVEKTRDDRESLTLIDEETQTYKLIVTSERGERVLGIFKARTDAEYFNWDASEYEEGFKVDLSSTSGDKGWSTYSSFHAKTFENVLDSVCYKLYEVW